MTEPEPTTEWQSFREGAAGFEPQDTGPDPDSISNELPPSDDELARWGQFGQFIQLALRSSPTPVESAVPEQIGLFRVLRVLAQGGNGTVYLAQDYALPRLVAIKVPRADLLHVQGTRKRFLQEAKLVAGLKHPQIVEIHQIGESSGQPFLVFEYCEGGSLADWLNSRHEALAPRTCAEITKMLASAVQHAHAQGILHRDLNPRNVLLAAGGETNDSTQQREFPFVVKLSDFGLGMWLNASQDAVRTQTGAVLGTIPYMAPEQTSGTSRFLQPTVDVHALGVILFELLAGCRPYAGETPVETLRLIRETAPPLLRRIRPDTPRDLETICLKCLEKSPTQRYSSAEQLADDLDRFLTHRPVLAHRASAAARAVQWMARHPLLSMLFAVICLLSGLIGVGTSWYSARLATSNKANGELQSKSRYDQEVIKSMAYAGQVRRSQELLDSGYDYAAGQLLRSWIPEHNQPDRRRFEWYYMTQASGGEIAPLNRRAPVDESLYSSCPSLDGKFLYVGAESAIEKWDLRDGARRQNLVLSGHQRSVRDIFAMRNGDLIFTRGGLSGIYHWSESQQREVAPLRKPGTELQCCNRVILSTDERFVYSLTSQQALFHPPTIIRSHAVDTGRLVWEKTWPHAHSFDVCVDSTLHRAVVIMGAQLIVLDSAGQIIQELALHSGLSPPLSLAISKNGASLAVALEDHGLLLCKKNGMGHWEPAGELPSIRRQVPTRWPGIPPGWFELRNPLAFAADNNRLFSACDTELHLWDVERRVELQAVKKLPHPVRSLKLLADGQTVAWGTAFESGTWNPQSRNAQVAGHLKETWSVAFSPNGRLMATGSDDNTIKIWDAQSGQELEILRGHNATVSSVEFSPDGRRLASASLDQTIRIWNIDSPGEVKVLRGHLGTVRCLDWSADSRTLVSGDHNRNGPTSIIVWDVANALPQQNWQDQKLRIRATLFLKDRRHCITVSEDLTAKLRELPAGTVKLTLRGTQPFHSAALLNHDHWLATGDKFGTIAIWDLNSGKLIRELQGHAISVRSLTASPDGMLLASGSEDATVRLWDPFSGECLLVLRGHQAPVNSVAFSPNGEILASGAHDGSVKLWYAPVLKSRQR